MGYQITAPPGITINQVVYDESQLQNIAQRARVDRVHVLERRHCARASERDCGRRSRLGPSSDTNLDSSYWGIELRCVQSVCSWPGRIQLDQITVYASEAQGPSITPVADPGSLWAQTGHWIWNSPGNAWSLPVAGADSSGVCSLSVQVGTGAPIADPSLPPPNNSSWQECQQRRAGRRRSTRASTSAAPGRYP